MEFISIFFLISWISCVYGEKIFMMHNFWVGSHLYTFRSLADIFVEMGHEVTILRYMEQPMPKPFEKKGITEIVLSINNTAGRVPFVTQEEHGKLRLPMEHLWKYGLTFREMPPRLYESSIAFHEDFLSRKSLIEGLKQSNFSFAISDLSFTDIAVVCAHILGIPSVGFISSDLTVANMFSTSSFILPSVSPVSYSWFPDNMTFSMRTINILYLWAVHVANQVQYFLSKPIIQKYYPGTPQNEELLNNLNGILADVHPALRYPRPIFPTHFEIGGIHLRDPKALPKELESFIQGSEKDGFILLSLGSSFNPEFMAEEAFESFFRDFSKLKQRVIVRSPKAPTWVPKNVKILPSVPQHDLLGHPKIVLFISHGGIKGLLEAMHFGVPTVAIPIFLDQMDNSLLLERRGAVKVVRKETTQENLLSAMEEVLSNKTYKENAMKQSDLIKLYEDPRKKVARFLKLMLHTKEKARLKRMGKDLNIFQYLCMDVALFLVFVVLIFFKVFSYMIIVANKFSLVKLYHNKKA